MSNILGWQSIGIDFACHHFFWLSGSEQYNVASLHHARAPFSDTAEVLSVLISAIKLGFIFCLSYCRWCDNWQLFIYITTNASDWFIDTLEWTTVLLYGSLHGLCIVAGVLKAHALTNVMRAHRHTSGHDMMMMTSHVSVTSSIPHIQSGFGKHDDVIVTYVRFCHCTTKSTKHGGWHWHHWIWV